MSEEKKNKITWKKAFPTPTAKRYELLCSSQYVIDGLKSFCEAGRPDISYNVMEQLLGRQLPILMSHPEFMPNACRVYRAKDLFDYEDDDMYIVAFLGISARSMQTEFSCIFFDDVLIYARVCTANEVYKVWEIFNREMEETSE